MYNKFLCSALTLLSVPSMASVQSSQIVYGVDNRVEIFETDKTIQSLASSTAAMIQSHRLMQLGDYIFLPPTSLSDTMNVCPSERFADQPAPAMCTGFLVGPDLLVTAGHCVLNDEVCSDRSWVFDFAVNESTGRADVLVDKNKVYNCKKVIESKLNMVDFEDYSLIQLDRVVEGRTPLKYRSENSIDSFADIFVIGHPSGLPSKHAGGASVVWNFSKHYFKTDLDTFGGNSGSAVFNEATNVVEGILVRGVKDYVRENGCFVVNNVPQQISNIVSQGESASRITDIKTLKYRETYLKAAADGDLLLVKKLLEEIKMSDIYDNSMNSALHKAAAAGHLDVVDYLVSKNVDLNLQNLKGETPLHLAAFNNHPNVIESLLTHGASSLIEDNLGFLASKRTMYLAFSTRQLLKDAEVREKKKKK